MITKYWKAWIAVLGTITTAVVTTAVDPDVVNVLPGGWAAAVAVAGTALTGVLVASKKNTPTFESVDAALDALPVEDLKALLAKWQSKSAEGPFYPTI